MVICTHLLFILKDNNIICALHTNLPSHSLEYFQFPPRTVQVHSTVGALGEGEGRVLYLSWDVSYVRVPRCLFLEDCKTSSQEGFLGVYYLIYWYLYVDSMMPLALFFVTFVLWQLWKWRSTHLVISWCCYGVHLHVRKHLDTGHPVPIVFSTRPPEAQMLEIDPVRLQVGLVDGYVGGQHPLKPVELLKIPRTNDIIRT